MRSAWSTGALLAAGGVVLVLAGSWLDLDVAPAALLGIALGGALAVAPGRDSAATVVAAGLGVLAAWIGYAFRALLLPDSAGGVAVALVVVVAVCALPTGLSRDRLPMWAALVGAGAFAGVYEAAYAAAPAEMATTSVAALTSTVLVLSVGFLLGAIAVVTLPARPGSTGAAADRTTSPSLETQP